MVSLFVIALLLVPLLPGSRTKNSDYYLRLQSRWEMSFIAEALKQFEIKNGKFPAGNNVSIIQNSGGTNSDEVVFLNLLAATNSAGEMLDSWKVPFKIEVLAQTNFTIRSAGKDKIFGDADDVIFNSVSNDFVKP